MGFLGSQKMLTCYQHCPVSGLICGPGSMANFPIGKGILCRLGHFSEDPQGLARFSEPKWRGRNVTQSPFQGEPMGWLTLLAMRNPLQVYLLHSLLPMMPAEFWSQELTFFFLSFLCHKGIAIVLIPACSFTLVHAWLVFPSFCPHGSHFS